MVKKLLSTNLSILLPKRIKQLIWQNLNLKSCAIIVMLLGATSHGISQQVDNWYSADRAVNVPSTFPGALIEFTPYAPADGTPVNIWYELVDFSLAFRQDAMEHPPGPYPANYNRPWENYPNHGFQHPSSPGFLTPSGSIPGNPTLRRNVMNFNPAIEFDPTGEGDALYFRSHARDNTTIFIVFSATGAGNTAETQSLLFGGDINSHLSSITNLSLGVSDGNFFSVGRTWDTGTFFRSGSIDLMERPTIGTFIRQVGVNQETLTTRVNGHVDPQINGFVRNDVTADEGLFYYNRMGKHFNDTDPVMGIDPSNLDGHIAEVFLVDGITDANHIRRLESYLAVKYGITLNGAGGLGSVSGNTSYDYLAADGTVIWDFDLANPYNFDIAGIGRDRFRDAAHRLRYNLHQRISKSVNTEAIVTISTNSSFTTDNLDDSRTTIDARLFSPDWEHNYLLWGNNRASLTSTNVELPIGTVTERISREWKVQKTSSPGATPINGAGVMVDLSSSDITIIPECALYLMIDTDGDGDFTTGPITYIEASSVDAIARIAEFHNVDFEHNQVFTIGFGDFTPPTGTIDDEVVCELANVPPVNIADVYNLDDNCAIASVTPQGDSSDGLSNPETITRTYRITDTSGNFTDVEQTIEVYTTPDAGSNNVINICVDDASVDLFGALGTTDASGIWTDDDMAMVSLLDPSNVDFTGVPPNISYNFTYTIDAVNPICSNDFATITVNISPAPSVNAGSDEQICTGDNLELSLSAIAPSAQDFTTLSWSTSGNGMFSDASILTPIYTPSADDILAGSVVLTLIADGCTTVQDTMILIIDAPVLADAPAPVTNCGTYNLPPLANGNYFDAPGGVGNSLFAGDPVNVSTTLYVFSPTNGSCPAVDNSFDITINAPVVADAYEPDNTTVFNECGPTHHVSALPAMGNGTWTQQSGPGTLFFETNAADYDQDLSVTQYGTYVFRWTVDDGVCSDFDEITVNFYEYATSSEPGPHIEQCSNPNFVMAANTPLVGTGEWTQELGPPVTITDVYDPLTTVTGVPFDQVIVLRWTITNGSCSRFSDLGILNYQQPIADAGADIPQCGNPNFIMAANTPLAGTGTWSQQSGPPVFISNTSSPTPIVTGLAAGNSAILRWTIANGTCSDSFDEITITNYLSPPVPLVSVTAEDCSGGATNTVDNYNAAITYTFNPAGPSVDGLGAITGGTDGVNYTITATNVDGCATDAPFVYDGGLQLPSPTLAINGFSDPTTCAGNDGQIVIAFTDVPNGNYTIDFDGGSFNNVIVNNNQATISNVAAGAYNDLAITVNGCTSSQFPLVNLSNPSTPEIFLVSNSNPTTCGGTDGSITLSINNLPDGGPYTIEYDGGNFPGQMLIAGQTTISNLSNGNYNNLKITVNGCTSVEDIDVTLMDPAAPSIDPLGNVSVCQQYILPVITGTNLTGNEAYYDLPGGPGGGGTLFNVGDAITVSGIYYIYDENGTCIDQNSFTITVNDTTDPTASNPLPIDVQCAGDVPAPDTAVVTDEADNCGAPIVAFVSDSSDGNANPETITRTYSVTDAAANTINVQQTITVNEQPQPYAGTDGNLTICEGDLVTPAQLFEQLGGTPDVGGSWSPSLAGAGVYTYTMVATAPCTSDATAQVTVTEQPQPDADAPDDVTECGSYILPELINGNYFTGPGGTGTPLFQDDVIANVGVNTIYVFSLANGVCPAMENSFTVTINSLSVSLNIGHESCWESGDGFIDVAIENGIGPFEVQLNSEQVYSFSNSNFTLSELNPGNYFIGITDANGCQTISEFDILPEGPNLDATIEPIYSCDSGIPTNSIIVNLNNPSIGKDVMFALDSTSPDDFILTPDFGNIDVGNHFLSILHTNGCLVSIPFIIESNTPLELDLVNSNTNEITANVSGGAPPYTYFFDNQPSSSNNTYTVHRNGTFLVRVLDGNGCEIIDTITINYSDINIPNFFTPNNDGENDLWRPRNIEPYPNIATFVLDRYGRKIKIMGSSNEGWDGTYESRDMPSGDYWFIIELNDGTGREFVGHFTLYR
ncbi:MAG: T9SS type B sorting domain-containing protein [Bacteroidota bacterium]